ncbi:YybH family protein [Oceanicoccus sagamiensis]|uniref:DUF4440 domain-containing protein n=1 Tax=Oceanicoccus sagamiensis TaxID=716816 RepID=A0A1X9NNL2_9GAMM|nr:nuclear transport factor 2 family protein [Oceanicoccus sagamiensis]ARN75483.1 hypothetical protein BST96_16015 [Oceanicoccus sagamiensis]
MSFLKLISLILFITSISACSSQKTLPHPEAAQPLHSQLKLATSYYNANDIESYQSLYTKDAYHISVRRPMVEGREAIGRFFAPGMKLFTVSTEDTILDSGIYGDTAHLLMKSTMTGTARPGIRIPSFTEQRIIMVLFKQRDGQWLIHRYIASFSPEQDRGVMAK